jgi:MFS family permease
MGIMMASLPAMLTKPVWGWLVDHMNPKPLAACSAFISGVAVLLIVVGVNGPDVRLAYAAFALLGVGWGGMIPLQEVIWAMYFGRRHLGSVRSAALPFALIMGAGGPLAVAYYCDIVGRYDGAFIAVGLMSILAAVLILALPKGLADLETLQDAVADVRCLLHASVIDRCELTDSHIRTPLRRQRLQRLSARHRKHWREYCLAR